MIDNFNTLFGSNAKPLAEQFAEQGISLPAETIEAWQRDSDAMLHLAERDFITVSQYDRLSHKLHERMRDVVMAGQS